MTDNNESLLRQQFGRHAKAYSSSASHAKGTDLALLLANLPLSATDHALDVATGTGHTAMALAEHVSAVTAMDFVPEMMAEGAKAAAERGLGNITWVVGDAMRMQFADASFDVVTCRRAAHHFGDLPAFISEVRRVLRPGGYFGLVDQVTAEDPELAELTEAMEKIHDPSHVRAFAPSAWAEMLQAAGLEQRFGQIQVETRSLKQFLMDTEDIAAKLARIEALLAAAPPHVRAGIGLVEAGGDATSFVKQRLVAVYTRPA